MKNSRNLRSKVLSLANQLRGQMPFSEALRTAWATVKNNQTAKVTFKKVSGEVTTRVVAINVMDFLTVKGTGRPTKPGQKLFADLAKVATGQYPIISLYQQNILGWVA